MSNVTNSNEKMNQDDANIRFDYCKSVAQELKVRQARNARYSLRSFARDLGVSVTALSDVLAGKRQFSKKNALKIIEKLGWSPLQKEAFLEDLSGRASKVKKEELILEDDKFCFVSDWYYLVILNLAKISDAKASPLWISKKIGISQEEARDAVDRLKRLGFISVVNGRLRRTLPNLQTTTNVPSAAIRKYHRQNFLVAENAQEYVPFDKRQISSFTVATDLQRIQKAKRMLIQFMDKLAEVLESDNPTEVYTVSTQLFPAKIIRGED